MAYSDALKPNTGLAQVRAQVNLFGIDLGAPALASTNRFVTTTNMKVGAYTVANAASVDGLPRNVTVTATTVAAGADTPGTVTITGTAADGDVITEIITPLQGSTVAGLKAFATVTGVVGAGWVIAGGNDTIVVGTGNLVGLPAATHTGHNPIDGAGDIIATLFGGLVLTPVVAFSATLIESCTVDGSAGTYDATKHLIVLCIRDA